MNEDAKKRALQLLDKRDYSRKMLIDKLTEKGASDGDAAEVADWLCELGVVNDARFAELIVRHYAAKGYGERRIRDELYRRGIDRDLWDEALTQLSGPEETAYGLLRAKLRGDVSEAGVKRAEAALLRRGFSWQEIRPALERYLNTNEEEP